MRLSIEFVRQKFVDLKCSAAELVSVLNVPDTPLMNRVMQHKIEEFSKESAEERERQFDLLHDMAQIYLEEYGCDYFGVSNPIHIPDRVVALILWLSPIDQTLPTQVFNDQERDFAARLVSKIGQPHLMDPEERYVDLVETHFEYTRCADMVVALSKAFSSDPVHSIECIRSGCGGNSRLARDTRTLLSDVMRSHFSVADRSPLVH